MDTMKRIGFFFIFSALFISNSIFAQENPCDVKTYYSLEEALKKPENVKKLDIAMQDPKLTTLPAEIGLFINLECLDLSFNRISELPEEFKNLQNLKVLILAGNRYMSKFPEVLKELPNLMEVDFTSIPEWSREKCDAAKAALPKASVLTDK